VFPKNVDTCGVAADRWPSAAGPRVISPREDVGLVAVRALGRRHETRGEGTSVCSGVCVAVGCAVPRNESGGACSLVDGKEDEEAATLGVACCEGVDLVAIMPKAPLPILMSEPLIQLVRSIGSLSTVAGAFGCGCRGADFSVDEDAGLGFLRGEVGEVFPNGCNFWVSLAMRAGCWCEACASVCVVERVAADGAIPSAVGDDNDANDDNTEWGMEQEGMRRGGARGEGDDTCQPSSGSWLPRCECNSDGEV